MTKDLNKNISSIQYNFLNLPTSITYSSGKSAAYIYDATGRKLQTSYKASPSATAVPTDYCGNMIYENGVLKQVLVDGGYMTVTGTPFYFYYLKDHLGSNRVVVSPAGTATQVNHYYPFGGLFGESTGSTGQRYKYNGKEFDRTHGLDWYDYGARHMSPDVGRFTTIDPLAEKYYSISPYAYCANNPVKFIDIKGEEPGDFFSTKDEAAKDFGKYYNPYSIKNKYEFASFIMYNPQKGMYYYPRAILGKDNSVNGTIPTVKSHKPVATIHTHGAYDKSLVKDGIDWNDEFSGMENSPKDNLIHVPQDKYDDIFSANKRGIDSYVVTPNGNLKKYNPKNGRISIISRDMPSDKNADDKRVNNIDVETNNILSQLINIITSFFK